MNYKLFKQFPKPKEIGIGNLDVDKNWQATFFENDINSEQLFRVKLSCISKDGITINGFEPIGYDKHGCQKFIYQEWFLSYEVREPGDTKEEKLAELRTYAAKKGWKEI